MRQQDANGTSRACRWAALLAAAVVLAACADAQYIFPDRNRTGTFYRNAQGQVIGGESVFGEGGLFGRPQQSQEGGGIGVNSYLWRASLDAISFMPVASADPFGGVIVTDWYTLPETPNERFKVNLFIMGRELRADGLKAAVFRQRRANDGNWQDVAVESGTGEKLEEAILTRAREMRIASRR